MIPQHNCAPAGQRAEARGVSKTLDVSDRTAAAGAAQPEQPEHRGDRRRFLIWAPMLGAMPAHSRRRARGGDMPVIIKGYRAIALPPDGKGKATKPGQDERTDLANNVSEVRCVEGNARSYTPDRLHCEWQGLQNGELAW